MGDNFIRGYDFATATGLKSGANLEDLVTLAKFAAGSDALDKITLEDNGAGAARVKALGIGTSHLALLSVDTPQIAAGALSADAAGQAKMEADYILPTHLSWEARIPSGSDLYAAKAYLTADYSMVKNADTKIPLDGEFWDFQNCFAGGRYTAKKDGIYLVSGTFRINDVPDGYLIRAMVYGSETPGGPTTVMANGTTLPGGEGRPLTWRSYAVCRVMVACQLRLQVGGYVEFWGYHEEPALGTNKDIEGSGTSTYFTVQLMARYA